MNFAVFGLGPVELIILGVLVLAGGFVLIYLLLSGNKEE